MPLFDFIEDADLKEKVENAHKLEVDELTVNLTNEAKVKVDEAVSGLKTKNAEILDEKKSLNEKLKAFDGIDVETAKVALKFHEENKDAEFLKDGTVEELIEKKISQLISDHETLVGELTENLTVQTARGDKYQSKFESKLVSDDLTQEAIKQGVRPEAVSDIVLKGSMVFSVGTESGEVEARDKDGKLAVTEDKKVLTVKNWIEGLKTTSPHYWPDSEGAGAFGGKGGSSDDITTKLNELAAAGKMKEYRALRDKHKKGKA